MSFEANVDSDPSGVLRGTRENARGLTDRAYEAVLDLVVCQALRPGDMVPERQMAEQLGVSRTPLREALRRLEGERILERRESGKLVIREMSVHDFMEVLHVRRMLEADAAARAAGRVPAAIIADLRFRLEKLLTAGDPAVPDHIATDEELHRAIAEAAGNRVAAEIISDLRRRTRMFSMRRMPERFEPICQEHLAIVATLEAADSEGAAQAVVAHLDAVKASIIARLAGI